MGFEGTILAGRHVRLEPLERRHAEGLAAASAVDPALYGLTTVPQGVAEAERYIDTALALREAGVAIPFATLRAADGMVLGSTRFFDIERWEWPGGHPRHGREHPDVCEIGWTWLTASAIRTPVNTEAKLLMLRHAFEVWGVLRVCLSTDARNVRSRAAMERIGAKLDGVMRAHRLAADCAVRDSARYSIVADEWAGVKEGLERRLLQA